MVVIPIPDSCYGYMVISFALFYHSPLVIWLYGFGYCVIAIHTLYTMNGIKLNNAYPITVRIKSCKDNQINNQHIEISLYTK